VRKLLVPLFVIALSAGGQALAQSGSGGKGAFQPGPFFGGNIGASFGDVNRTEISPLIGYQFLPSLAAGVQLTYAKNRDKRVTPSETTTDYGGSLFARYSLTSEFFVTGEYQYLSYELPLLPGVTERDTYSTFLAGVGYSQRMGDHSAYVISALYDFNYSSSDLTQPYDSPWIFRAGIVVGF